MDKPLKVFKYRDHYCINAKRVGLVQRYGNYKTEAAAKKAAAELLVKADLGITETTTAIKLGDAAAKKYFAQLQLKVDAGKIGNEHYKDTKRCVKYVLDIKINNMRFGSLQMQKIVQPKNSELLVNTFSIAIERGSNSKSRAAARLKMAKAFLNFCQLQGYITNNFLDKVTLGQSYELSSRTDRVKNFSSQTMRDVLEVGLKGEADNWRVMFLVAMYTGMRQGEIRALTWADIDFDAGEVSINKAVKRYDGHVIGTTKTKRGNRIAVLPADAIQELRKLRMQSRFSADADIIFATNTGQPKQPKTIRELMYRIQERTGIDIIWSDLRHYFASHMITQLGTDWAEIAASMGHTNSNFTYQQYGHSIRNAEKQNQKKAAAAAMLGV